MTTSQRSAQRAHGTRTCYVNGPGPGSGPGCRCEPCSAANREQARLESRLRAYGQWQPYVDAEPVRQYVCELRASGTGWRRVAELAGLSQSTLSKILYGGPGDRPPAKGVRAETAKAILAVRPSLAPHALTDATGTHRRVQALVAGGHSQAQLAGRLSMTRPNFGSMMQRDQVTVETREAVRELYDQLWNQPPAEQDHHSRQAASRARNHAAERGWVPPLAWDDDKIDDPAARPAEGWQRSTRKTHRSAELAEDAAELLTQGSTREQAAERLGVKLTALEQALLRTRQREADQATAEHETQRAVFADAAAAGAEAGYQAEAV
jgi:transcriptional regulator with XRE-family HTH domain